jgi:hypothetical protein
VLEGRARPLYRRDDPSLAVLPDIALAELNADGLVQVTTDLWILKPVDLAKGNGALLSEVVNRGNKRYLQFFNEATHGNAPIDGRESGSGFLTRQG